MAPGQLPEGVAGSFAWDAPRADDRAEYAYSIVRTTDGGLEPVAPEETQLRFSYAAPQYLLDSLGQAHPVRALSWAERPLFGWSTQPTHVSDIHDLDGAWLHPDVAFLHLDDARVVGVGMYGADQAPARPDEPAREGATFHVLLEENGGSEAGSRPPCVASTSLQGDVADLRRPFVLWRDCVLGTHLVTEGTFRPVAAEIFEGVACVTFASVRLSADQWPLTSPRAWATYCADHPYPIRVAFQHWRDGDDQPAVDTPTYSVLRLAALSRGPPASALGPAPETAPPLGLLPRQPYGPDEAGIEHPFPLSAAYAALAGGSSVAPQAAALANDREGAYVLFAEFAQVRRPDGVARTWSLLLTDGNTLSAADVVQTQDASGAAIVRVEPVELPEGAWGQRWPRPDSLPADLPSVSSLAEAYTAHWSGLGASTAFNAWGIRIEHADWACGNLPEALLGDRDCSAVQVQLHAGSSQRDVSPGGDERREERFLDVGWSPDRQSRSLRAWLDANGAWVSPDAAPTPAFSIESTVAQRPDLWAFPPLGWVLLAGAAGAVLVAAARWMPLAIGGFSRLVEPRALAHPARSQIVAAVEARPGIHEAELARATGLPEGTLRHHLRQLRLVGILVRGSASGYACYFRRGRVDRRLMDAAPLTRADWATRVLAEIERTPGLSLTQLSASLQAAPTTLHHHVAALRRAGLVSVEAEGRTLHLHITDLGRQARAMTSVEPGT